MRVDRSIEASRACTWSGGNARGGCSNRNARGSANSCRGLISTPVSKA
jgi:hypothetical protein